MAYAQGRISALGREKLKIVGILDLLNEEQIKI